MKAAREKNVAIIGAGPAGLTAGYLLAKSGVNVTVFEQDPLEVGGISRTVKYKGFHFDIGGHRFFSKSKEVEDFWTEILPHDFIERPRSSRIAYNKKFYSYPLKAFEALFNLGVLESILCVLSYVKIRLFPIQNPSDFESWVTNQFGRRLFRIFFKTYTEKVWGMKCSEISADWAAQRIKGLSLGKAIWHALLPQKNKNAPKSETIKTLIDTFRYPRKGPGMMWDACALKMKEKGGKLVMGTRVKGLEYHSERGLWHLEVESQGVAQKHSGFTDIISTAPIKELVHALSPKPTAKALEAAASLRYRDFLTVVLIMPEKHIFDDNWIYIHDPGVKVGRIQNFKSWSPEMVPDPSLNCYGLEYFCFEGDGLWNMKDEDLVQLGIQELEKLGLGLKKDLVDGCVVRQIKAYPVYDDQYKSHVEAVREEIKKFFPGLHLVGRNGMHKYNNQDHAMMTAMLAAQNILLGEERYNLWGVNQDAEYHESGDRGAEALEAVEERLVPKKKVS